MQNRGMTLSDLKAYFFNTQQPPYYPERKTTAGLTPEQIRRHPIIHIG